jgi:hypothetical protein
VGNHVWRPYGDRGRWVYTDCGWYWQSDYSWGWAAFHYGRWFNDARLGWCWAPDRVWGPAWVSWRSSADYCGWAPLPPSAKYVPLAGFVSGNHLVGADFDFGLQAQNYTFIPLARMSDYAPARYAVPRWQADEVFGETALNNHFAVKNNRVVNYSLDPRAISTASRTEIRHAQIRDLPRDPNHQYPSDRMAKTGGGMVIYRPQLPMPSARRPGNTMLQNPRSALPPSLQPANDPTGSTAVIGPKNSALASSPSRAPLPNMNLSYLARQNNAANQAGENEPAYRAVNYGSYASAPVPETPGYALPAAGFSFRYDPSGPNFSAHPAAQFQPAQNQSTYVMPGRFSANDMSNGNIGRNSASSAQNQNSAAMPARFSVNDRLAGNSDRGLTVPAPALADSTVDHVRAAAASAESLRLSQESRPAEPAHTQSAPAEHSAPAASSTSSSSSSRNK